MRADRVLQKGSQFVACMADIVPPERFLFRTYATRGSEQLRTLAKQAKMHCRGTPDSALASLTVREGASNDFALRGAHAVATVTTTDGQHARVVCTIVVVCVMLLMWMFYARAPARRHAERPF